MEDESSSEQDHSNESFEDNLTGLSLAPRQAKSLLRARRWSISQLKDQHISRDEEEYERQQEQSRARACLRSCWGEWSAWSRCSAGTQQRSRDSTKSADCKGWIDRHGCPGPDVETRSCVFKRNQWQASVQYSLVVNGPWESKLSWKTKNRFASLLVCDAITRIHFLWVPVLPVCNSRHSYCIPFIWLNNLPRSLDESIPSEIFINMIHVDH